MPQGLPKIKLGGEHSYQTLLSWEDHIFWKSHQSRAQIPKLMQDKL